MTDIFSRNKLHWGEDFQKYLGSLYIAVVGLGGVGGFALDALARAGVGKFLIADFDTVSESNINRQLIALHSTIGRKKADIFNERIKDINPDAAVVVWADYVSREAFEAMFYEKPDFIVDAIDTLKSKIELINFAKINGIEIVSSLGAGNRMDASKLYVADISEIKSKDSFTKNVLHKLKKYSGIENGLTVVTSSETPHSREKICNIECIQKQDGTTVEFTKFTPSSTPVVPAVAGYLAANHILQTCYKKFLSETM